jgi:hypothetical protein
MRHYFRPVTAWDVLLHIRTFHARSRGVIVEQSVATVRLVIARNSLTKTNNGHEESVQTLVNV